MRDRVRPVFWLDIAVLLVLAFLALRGKWDWVIAIFLALVVTNFFDHLMRRRQPRP